MKTQTLRHLTEQSRSYLVVNGRQLANRASLTASTLADRLGLPLRIVPTRAADRIELTTKSGFVQLDPVDVAILLMADPRRRSAVLRDPCGNGERLAGAYFTATVVDRLRSADVDLSRLDADHVADDVLAMAPSLALRPMMPSRGSMPIDAFGIAHRTLNNIVP